MMSELPTMAFAFYSILGLICVGCGIREKLAQSSRRLSEYCTYTGSEAHLGCKGRLPPSPSGVICECPCHGCVDCREGS